MSFESLLIHSVTVYNRVAGIEGRYGDESEVWDAGTSYPARVQSLSIGDRVREFLVNRDTVRAWFEIYMLPNVNVNAQSVIEWEGKRLSVDGQPSAVFDGTGLHHVRIVAVEVVG